MAPSASAKQAKPLIYDLSRDELQTLLASWGEKNFRVDQIWQGLYKQFYNQPEQFTTLSKAIRLKLTEYFRFSALEPVRELAAKDGNTIKTYSACLTVHPLKSSSCATNSVAPCVSPPR